MLGRGGGHCPEASKPLMLGEGYQNREKGTTDAGLVPDKRGGTMNAGLVKAQEGGGPQTLS